MKNLAQMAFQVLEPRDPLIARDGRPFDAGQGARAKSLPFPPPSMIAGGVRTRSGQDSEGVFHAGEVERIKAIQVGGPLLVELNEGHQVTDWLLPAPADCLLMPRTLPSGKSGVVAKRMVPAPVSGLTTAAAGCEYVAAVQVPNSENSKPMPSLPFWRWKDELEPWLRDPQPEKFWDESPGRSGPTLDSRVHVRLAPEEIRLAPDEKNREEGRLFGTRGLEFRRAGGENRGDLSPHGSSGAIHGVRRLGLALWHDAESGSVPAGAGRLGAERRHVLWQESCSAATPMVPGSCTWLDEMASQRSCRLVLLTPAHFKAGWLPGRLLQPLEGIDVVPRLVTACVGRPQVISGWDMASGTVKPTRRLAPAGSVYFLDFGLNAPKEAVLRWLEAIWLRPVSDSDEACRDGFGLAALGVWNAREELAAL